VCALAVIFFIAAMLLVSPAGYEVSETGENMSVGAPLLSQGDELAYEVAQGNASSGLTVRDLGLDAAAGCEMLRQEYPGQQNITACYSENGTVAYVLSGTVPLAREEFAGVPVIHAFEPWMAGARVGWSGAMVVTRSLKPGLIQIMQLGESIETRYRCTGEENASGRRALRVESDILRNAGGGNLELLGRRIIWIDYEKRVVLKEESSAQGISETRVLVRAPFPLNLTSP